MTETKPPTSNAGEDVLQFLETLDTYSQTTATNQETGGQPPADTQSVLDFLDQFAKTPSATANAQNNSSSKGEDNQSSLAEQPEQPPQPPPPQQKQKQQLLSETQEQKQEGAWSWGGLLASASTAYKTASNVVDSSVKEALATVETVRTNEGTKKFEEKFRGILNKEAIGKIGLLFIFFL
jgi:hypothetical protein